MLCGDVTLDGKAFSYSRGAKFFHEDEMQYDLELEKALGSLAKRRGPAVTKIGEEAALKIALDDAGLKQSQVRDIDVELERGDRGEYYEVGFEKGVYEYEYLIEAYTGEILSARRARD
jgi:uncharacterized membrane protein YkoI